MKKQQKSQIFHNLSTMKFNKMQNHLQASDKQEDIIFSSPAKLTTFPSKEQDKFKIYENENQRQINI